MSSTRSQRPCSQNPAWHSGPLCHVGFWLHGRWDRVLDTMDSRPGVGYGFPVPPPSGRPGPAGAQEPVQPR